MPPYNAGEVIGYPAIANKPEYEQETQGQHRAPPPNK
jgi:hypothetical protein